MLIEYKFDYWFDIKKIWGWYFWKLEADRDREQYENDKNR